MINLDDINVTDMNTTKDYYDILKESVNDIKEYDGILRYLPALYRVSCNIIADKKTNWYARILVNCALSYLVLEKDVFPDKHTKEGYLDDLFLFSYILKEIRDKISKNIIIDNLRDVKIEERGEKFLDLIYDIHSQTSEFLDGKEKDLLNFVGLSKFNAMDLLCSNDRIAQITRAKKKLKLVYAMAAVVIKDEIRQEELDIHNSIKGRHSKKFKEFITNHPEYGEIKRYGAFL